MLHESFKQCSSASYTTVENSGDFSVQRAGNTLRIFFEWSDSKEDWKNNFKFLAIPGKAYKNMTDVWLCHRGFLKVWKSIEPYLSAEILNPEIDSIEVVGYSHGAAIAVLCYEYCTFNRPDAKVTGIGFGCPRVFWGHIPESLEKRFLNFQAVRNGQDIVTHVPPAVFGFKHAYTVTKIGKYNPMDYLKQFILKFFGVLDHFPEEYLNNSK